VSAVKTREVQARPCYDRVLAADRTLRGRMRVLVRLRDDGSVCETRVLASDLPADMGRCVARVLGGTSYPPPSGGCIDVEVPLTFVPPEADAGGP
jgi:hypothetical protein